MTPKVLRGSKQEIVEQVSRISGDVREAILFVDEPVEGQPAAAPAGDIFAEMEPFTIRAGAADYSREALYSRMNGE